MRALPIVRSHERIDYKRCPKKWYYKWRLGLVPRAISFGALDLGSWMHLAFQDWYQAGRKRNGSLAALFADHAQAAIKAAGRNGAPDHAIDQADQLALLGEAMAGAYESHYGKDAETNVIAAELPLEFTISDPVTREVIAIHRLKPDLVFADSSGDVWLMEHKTAAQIRTDHLSIDDQARPYGVMAERPLRKAGLIKRGSEFKGIVYNFLRKAFPDDRERNADGKALNKNGSVSKRQPAALFARRKVRLTDDAKRVALDRIYADTVVVTELTKSLRSKHLLRETIPTTPHHSCPRFCQYFSLCELEEQGGDWRGLQRSAFVRRDPYDYGESTDEPNTFEMG